MMLFAYKSTVILKDMGIPVTITAIEIRETVRYEVTYYLQGVQQKIWVLDDEIVQTTKKNKVGFKKE